MMGKSIELMPTLHASERLKRRRITLDEAREAVDDSISRGTFRCRDDKTFLAMARGLTVVVARDPQHGAMRIVTAFRGKPGSK